MNFLIQVLIAVAMAIIFKPKLDPVKPPSGSDLEFPTVDETRKIPIVYGTVLLKSVAIFWAGKDFEYEEEVQDGGLFGDDITLGFKYYVSLAVAISFGEIKLNKIYFNEALAWSSSGEFGEGAIDFQIDEPKLFKTEGDIMADNGVQGKFNLFSGTQDQEISSHIELTEGFNKLPVFKNLAYIVFKNFYWGNDRRLPQPDVEVERLPNNILDDEDYYITGSSGAKEANPVEIIFDIMTNEEFYGVSIPSEKIDKENFKAVGKQLKDEGFGLSLIFEGGSIFEDIKKDIQKHISCNIFMSYTTGKWTIKLNRQDYNIEDLRTFNESNIKTIQKYNKREIANLASELKITYVDRNNFYKKRSLSAKSPSILRLRGNPKIEEDEFLACKDKVIAAKIASREIKSYTKPLISLILITDRTAFGLQIGDVIIVNYSRYNINNKTFRITEVDLGDFNKRQIKLSLIEDIFTFGEQVVSVNEDNLYEQPTDVDLLFDNYNFEAPVLFGENHNMITCFEKHNTRSNGYAVYIEEDADRILRLSSNVTTSYSILIEQINVNQNEIYLKIKEDDRNFELNIIKSASVEERLQGFNFAVITDGVNQEFISFKGFGYDFSNDRYKITNLWRGCIDTVPKPFPSGSKIYFLDYGSSNLLLDETNTDNIIKTYDLERKFYTKSDLIYKNDETIQFTRRFNKPLYPYKLTINSNIWGNNEVIDGIETYTAINLNTDLSLEWFNADRNKTIRYVNRFDTPTTTNEPNTIYNLRIYDDADVLIKTESGLTAQTYVFTDETTINPGGVYYPKLRFELETERDGIISKEWYNVKILRQ